MQAAQRTANGVVRYAHLHDIHRYATRSELLAAPQPGEESARVLHRLDMDDK